MVAVGRRKSLKCVVEVAENGGKGKRGQKIKRASKLVDPKAVLKHTGGGGQHDDTSLNDRTTE